MRLAITGTTGRVGRALADHLADGHEVLELPREACDLASPDLLSRLRELEFDALLNPAAITSLELCEDEPELAQRVNAEAPGELASMCREAGRRLLHFSTDYVLAGDRPGLHGEDAPLGPCSVYGRTKLEGERRVLDRGGCVMRVSWVFGPERPAFPDQIIKQALAGEPMEAVGDKKSLPGYTRDLVGWVRAVMEAGFPNQAIHSCNGGDPVSWHGMAEEIVDFMFERGDLKTRPIIGRNSLTEIAGFRAERPRHTAMATEILTGLLGKPPRDWREALREHVAERLIIR
ncbi:SDR family oxidoreductase [Haloferula sp.]|uniref:SDR family oxidoreductase n=1 Tax=Haloferula sp. TaxID=2497595 RepID=UPI00329FE2F0